MVCILRLYRLAVALKITLLSNAYERINSIECSSKDLKPDDIKLIFPSLSDLNDNILLATAVQGLMVNMNWKLNMSIWSRDNNRVELDVLLNNCISAIDQGKVVYGNKVYKDFTDLSELNKI